jgi:hypothetical protein
MTDLRLRLAQQAAVPDDRARGAVIRSSAISSVSVQSDPEFFAAALVAYLDTREQTASCHGTLR